LGFNVNEKVMVNACDHELGRGEVHTAFQWGKMEDRNRLEDLGRIILNEF